MSMNGATTVTTTTTCRASVARLDGLRARRVGAMPKKKTVTPMALRNFDYPEALLFDCDGVLCETERDGHRVTFNATFKEFGIAHEWDVETYGELLKIGGGKERMTHFFDSVPDTEPWKSVTDPEERKALKCSSSS
jgi:hypothetical protein